MYITKNSLISAINYNNFVIIHILIYLGIIEV